MYVYPHLTCRNDSLNHYENLPMQYIEIFFSDVKIENFARKTVIVFTFMLKTYIVGTRQNRLSEAVLTSTHNVFLDQK